MNYKYTMEFTNGLFGGTVSIIMEGDTSVLAENVIIIDTVEELDTYLIAYNTGLKNIVLVDGIIQIVDKYTPEELAARQAQEAKQQQLNSALALFNQSIKLESGAYQRRMSAEEKNEFEAWQDALLDFIDGNSDTFPIQPVFINTLLGA